jgi:hypothetical protein
MRYACTVYRSGNDWFFGFGGYYAAAEEFFKDMQKVGLEPKLLNKEEVQRLKLPFRI